MFRHYLFILGINQNNGSNALTIFHMPLRFRFLGSEIDTTVTIPLSDNPPFGTSKVLFNQLPSSVMFDSDNWLLKMTYLGIEKVEITLLPVEENFLVEPNFITVTKPIICHLGWIRRLIILNISCSLF